MESAESVAYRKKMLFWMVVANVVTSIGHYVDNVLFFAFYPEPTWLNAEIVDIGWFIMTPFGVAGYRFYRDGYRSTAFATLYVYAIMNLLVLGHYLIAPPWDLSFRINLFILAEAATAVVLAGYTIGLNLDWWKGERRLALQA